MVLADVHQLHLYLVLAFHLIEPRHDSRFTVKSSPRALAVALRT